MDILICLILAMVIFSTWLHAIFDTGICHAIFDTGICHAIFDTDVCHATLDPWHLTPALGIYTGTQYLHRPLACYTDMLFMTLALGIYTGTRYMDPVLEIWHTWHLHLTHGIWYAFMWYKYLDLTSRLLTGHYHPWCLYYMTYSWLSLLQGLGMTIILLPDIWYSWTPVLLYNPWNREAPDITPDIILMLIPVIG